jgi:hypothetical protein
VLNTLRRWLRPAPAPEPPPRPRLTSVSYLMVGSKVVSSVVRVWRPGDAERCRLCRRCQARGDLCNIPVLGYVSRAQAPGFSTVGLREQPPLDALRGRGGGT